MGLQRRAVHVPAHHPPYERDRRAGARPHALGPGAALRQSLTEFKGFSTINTRAESILKTAMWRVPFQRRHCLVPADGFCEWKKIDPKTKQPYAFAVTDREPFAFAGLWDDGRTRKGTGFRVSASSPPMRTS
jgi:putative SOS response-associated peptidase YedK